ncbi:MAG: type II toxin-antitoxin system HicB family antitoxin [Patescibacteria group bacterium]
MITEFINKKLKTARYKILDDGIYFGEIPGLKGVWASAKTLENCRAELQEILEDWLLQLAEKAGVQLKV